jgi:hypothetical protein
MTCPTVTPGSVTGQTGTINGWTSAYVDASGDQTGADFNWLYTLILSDRAGVGGRYQANQVIKGERWLVLSVAAGKANSQDPIPLSGYPVGVALTISSPYEHPTGSGTSFQWAATFVAKGAKNCNASEEAATGGTVTVTTITDTVVEGSYDLYFGSDHLTGSFVAPRAGVNGSMDVTGCPTRPSNSTCISG